jgi:hypothetical protein
MRGAKSRQVVERGWPTLAERIRVVVLEAESPSTARDHTARIPELKGGPLMSSRITAVVHDRLDIHTLGDDELQEAVPE